MKKLFGCALAVLALATTAKAELIDLWTNHVFTVVHSHDSVPPNTSTQFLASLTSDRDNTVNKLSSVQSSDGTLVGLVGEDGTNQQMFPMSQISSNDGAVLVAVSGRNAVILKGNVDATNQGRFTIKYLSNGLFMSYKTCDFNLKHDSKGFWIQNAYTGATVTDVHVVTTSIGISTVQGICP